MAKETYNFGLVEAGEQEVVRVLQQCLQRQSNADSLNKQLFQDRSNYLSDKKVKFTQMKMKLKTSYQFRKLLKKTLKSIKIWPVAIEQLCIHIRT